MDGIAPLPNIGSHVARFGFSLRKLECGVVPQGELAPLACSRTFVDHGPRLRARVGHAELKAGRAPNTKIRPRCLRDNSL
jgi:hypothetical protein